MTISESIAEKVVDARQLATTFAGPCLYLAGFAMLAGIGIGAYGMRHWDKGDIQEAKAAVLAQQNILANLRAEMATQRADVIKQGSDERDAAQAQIAQWLGQMRADYLQIPARVAAQLTPQFEQQFRSLNNAANLKCLDDALPSSTLRMLERPASGVTAAGVDTHP